MNKVFYLINMIVNFKAESRGELLLVALIGGISGMMIVLSLFKSIPGLFIMFTGLLVWSIVVRRRSQDVFKERDDV